MPFSIVLLSSGFLVLQSTTKPYLFKSPILAVLLHGLEGWDLSEMQLDGSRVTYHELQEQSKSMVAKLRRDESGSWKLKKG